MSLRRLAAVVFIVIEGTGVAMLTASLVGVLYREWTAAGRIAVAASVVIVVGEIVRRLLGLSGVVSVKEGFAAIGLSWIAMTLVGTIPYLVTGSMDSLTNAVFEASSGFSTTGASVVADPASLSHAVLWWRSLSQWLGGLGAVVVAVAVVPMLGISGLGVTRSEAASGDRRQVRVREMARRLAMFYTALTAVTAVLFSFSDMSPFEAVANAFTTMSTGGFTTRAGSMGAFNSFAQYVSLVFMVIAGTSFALHLRALREPGRYLRHVEFRVYLSVLTVCAVVLTVGLASEGVGRALRLGVFSAVSLVTTTGFTLVHPSGWPSGLQIVVVGMMFLGGMAGSSAGGIKSFRLATVAGAARIDLRRMIHPLAVFRTRLGGDAIEPEVVGGARAFTLFYLLAFLVGTLLLGVLGPAGSPGDDLLTSASAVASALGNVGPGLGAVDPSGGYAALPGAARWLLSSLMIVGRLEIFPIALLFTRGLWRR